VLSAVLFDLDGVLVDSRTAIARSLNHALVTLGRPARPEAELHPLIGPPLHEAFAELLAGRGPRPVHAPDAEDAEDEVDRAVGHYRERYRTACVEETLPMPGVAEALAALAPRLPLAVATSKPVEFARPILEILGLAGWFRGVEGPSLAARSEPKAHTVARALAALGPEARRGRVALVGDRLHDVVAGRAHGLLTIGVTWGIGSATELREAGAERLVTRPAELIELLLGPDADAAENTGIAQEPLEAREAEAARRSWTRAGCYSPGVREATARERRHFAAIAEGEERSAAEQIERALVTPPGQRILEGIRLGAATPWTPAHLAELDARTDGQMELARRRIALGLGDERAD